MKSAAKKKLLLVVMLLAAELLWAGQQKDTSSKQLHAVPPKSQNAAQGGERAFQVHCARCHHAPEQIPPSIAGTVLRHMRVRALLTPQDEQLLMKYLAP
jgi:hypothetical protein